MSTLLAIAFPIGPICNLAFPLVTDLFQKFLKTTENTVYGKKQPQLLHRTSPKYIKRQALQEVKKKDSTYRWIFFVNIPTGFIGIFFYCGECCHVIKAYTSFCIIGGVLTIINAIVNFKRNNKPNIFRVLFILYVILL